jgi:hypothetical protein
MHESAARAAVAVDEWVDRLELRMCDRGLHNSGERVVVAEAAEVFEEIAHEIRWRWDERGRAGVVVAATDPILLKEGVGKWVNYPSSSGSLDGSGPGRSPGLLRLGEGDPASTRSLLQRGRRLAAVRALQQVLYRAAKAGPNRRFHALPDKVHGPPLV